MIAEVNAQAEKLKELEQHEVRRILVGRYEIRYETQGPAIHSDINLLRDSGARSGGARAPHILLCMLRHTREDR